MMDYQFWSSRYRQQAGWTKQLRDFIINQLSLPKQAKILEVGCGSCAVLDDFSNQEYDLFGLDIDYQILKFSNQHVKEAKLINANGMHIPFQNDTFDLCFCHYLLLWLKEPESILQEMVRVLKKSRWICCFAEPDYHSRIDFPSRLENLGLMQNSALIQQGVNIKAGRNLVDWIKQNNLSNIYWGILGSHQNPDNDLDRENTEWSTLERDLQNNFSQKEVSYYKKIVQEVNSDGIRILFIPTFYVYAQKQ